MYSTYKNIATESPGWLIKNIEEASKTANKMFLIYIGALSYCALTIVGITDKQLVLNDSVRLPIINLSVSANAFFCLSPLIILSVFVYFQLHLHKLKIMIEYLGANYDPIYRKRIYPWLINMHPEKGLMGCLQTVFVNFSLWWSLPTVLMLLALWFVKKHDPIYSRIIGAMPLIGTLFVLYFRRRFGHTKISWQLRNKELIESLLLIVIVLIFELSLFIHLIPTAEDGEYLKLNVYRSTFINVNLSDQVLVTIPKKNEEKYYKKISWLKLPKAKLQGANLTRAILTRANLNGAFLQKADLSEANLQESNLQNAQLQGTTLTMAELQKANLRGANLRGAKLQNADLADANLAGANLADANLESTVNLTLQQLSLVKTLYRAKLDSILMKGIIEKYPHLLAKPKDRK